MNISPLVALNRVALAAVLANATWFSATAALPALRSAWKISESDAGLLVAAVQVGFVVGSLGAALLNLPDRLEPRRLIATSSVVAALANLALVLCGGLPSAIPIRFIVGVALAGVYAPAVRLVSTYFERSRGIATGVVVGALTLGSGTPHLVHAFASYTWQGTMLVTSTLALVGAVAVLPVAQGPGRIASPKLDVHAAVRLLRHDRPVRLTTLGYLGHMWELYAFWSWLAVFFAASQRLGPNNSTLVGTVAFAAVGVAGFIGSVGAGWLADRRGRTLTTSIAMTISGTCCLLSPAAFNAPQPLVIGFLCVWGASVVADSAQFSAAVTELAEPKYAGSVLALQLALGFTLTIVSIRFVPIVADAFGWRHALMPLAIGPGLGTVAMLRLRRLPASLRLAGGRR